MPGVAAIPCDIGDAEQLKGTSVKVFEVVFPRVDTNQNKAGRDRAKLKSRGVTVADYIPGVVEGLERDTETIFHGDGERVLFEPRSTSESRLLSPSW